ncbi:cupin domain-containing protein [Microbacterium sp. No. 7]|uniref:cupin domain-containing protein n=1 Tax=Microbacterium sp. No. 7 TaxID=1714373 RepID=UPI0006D126E6|nr:cupin domain-containing protein [Microbacterium sp. No. 7]
MTEITPRPPVRRVVTGHDDEGRAIILSDGPAPNTFRSDTITGFGASVAWFTDSPDVDMVTDRDPAPVESIDRIGFPLTGQTVFRIADFPPDAVYPQNAGDAVFEEINGQDEREAGSEHSSDKHFWFHRTDSIDYAIVIDGEITLLVDDGEVTLKPGDVAIQRATAHAWSNRTDKIARVAFVLIGTPPITTAEIAEKRAEAKTAERV